MRREVEQTGQLFETYLQNQEAAPEKAESTPKAIENQTLQPSSFVVEKMQAAKQASSFTDSLVGLLEQDISRHRQKQEVFSQEVSMDFEPRPIAGFNPFDRQMSRQGSGSSCVNLLELQSDPRMGFQRANLSCPGIMERNLQSQLNAYESDSGFHSCPGTLYFPQGFDELLQMSDTQQQNTCQL